MKTMTTDKQSRLDRYTQKRGHKTCTAEEFRGANPDLSDGHTA